MSVVVGRSDLQAVEERGARDVLAWAVDTFSPRIALVSSFGAEGVVLIDMLTRIDRSARIIALDTGRLHAETHAVMDAIRERYGVAIQVLFPKSEAVEALVRERGVNLFYKSVENRKECCDVRKVEPLGRALTGLDAWITGLRREQAVTRAEVRKAAVDTDHGGIVKVNPLADWSWDQVWEYIRAHDVPYNALHDQGYPSIGMRPAFARAQAMTRADEQTGACLLTVSARARDTDRTSGAAPATRRRSPRSDARGLPGVPRRS